MMQKRDPITLTIDYERDTNAVLMRLLLTELAKSIPHGYSGGRLTFEIFPGKKKARVKARAERRGDG